MDTPTVPPLTVSTMRAYARRDPIDRFVEKIVFTEGCWLYEGWRSNGGYGGFYMSAERPKVGAHRFAWETFVGLIPEGHDIDHVYAAGCVHRNCVNPDHLEPCTHLENTRRGVRARQTHCIRGHEFTVENTYLNPRGQRGCRQCIAIYREQENHRRASRECAEEA